MIMRSSMPGSVQLHLPDWLQQEVDATRLYAHDDEDLRELSPAFAGELRDLQYNFRKLANTEATESQVLVLRFSRARRPSVASRRRGPHHVSSPTG